MKKYVLISSVLAVSLATHCMEKEASKETSIVLTNPYTHASIKVTSNCGSIKDYTFIPECPSQELTPEAQERMSLVPKVPFSLNDTVMNKLQTTNYNIKKLDQKFNAEILTLSPLTVSNTDPYTYTHRCYQYKLERDKLFNELNDKLPLLLISKEKAKELHNLSNNIAEEIKSQESALSDQLRDKQITQDEFHSQPRCIKQSVSKSPTWTTIIDEYILLYRNAQEIKQLAEDELAKNEFEPLFVTMKEKYQKEVHDIIAFINNLVETLNNLPQEQHATDK